MCQDTIILRNVKHLLVSSYGVYYNKFYIELIVYRSLNSAVKRVFLYVNIETKLLQDTHEGKRMSKHAWVVKYLFE